MKTFYSILLFIFLWALASENLFAQCPNYSPVNYFDTTCYKYLPSELKVGQGHLGSADLWGTAGANSFDFYIPVGREGWAISVIHSWQVLRNTLKYDKDILNWHFYFGHLLKESFGACDHSISFSGINRCDGSALVNPFNVTSNYTSNLGSSNPATVDGCFQIDHSTGYPVIELYYPWRWYNTTQFSNYIAADHFETATLAKAHYDLAYLRLMEYVKGYPVQDLFLNTLDSTGPTKMVAMAYNKGYGGTPENIFNTTNEPVAKASSDWFNMAALSPSLNYDYTRAVTLVTRVLSNNFEGGWTRPWSGTGYANTSDNQWHCWYDTQISWSIMTTYMNKFFPLYPEVNSTAVTANVKAVFDAINGGSPISFRYDFAPVLDEFILNLPYDDPMQEFLYSTAGYSGCKQGTGCIGPAPTLKALGATTFCQGLSVNLETIFGTGYTYQWLKDGSTIANTNTDPNIFVATQSGTYSVKATNSSGCTVESDCQISVNVISCSSCSMTAMATATNNSCTGTPDGSVTVALTNAGFPVTYNWSGPTSGNTQTLTNVSDGTFTVTVTKQSDATCVAYATVSVNPAITLYQKLSIDTTRVDCQTIDLGATVVDDPPASCEYHLKLVYNGSGGCWGFWDKSILNILAFVDNVNLNVSTPRANGSGNCTHLDETITVPHNKTLVVDIKNLSSTTATGPDFTLQLVDPQGNTVWTYNLNGKSFATGSTSIYTGTTDCTEPMPTYTMTWSPTTDLTNIIYGTNTASATAVLTTDRTYTITAQHPTQSTCKMSETIFADYTCPGGLPVEWLSFEATASQGKVHLSWATTTEKNSDYFYIESSKDGIHFQTIGFADASHHSSSIRNYSYFDGHPHTGSSYYRIKEVDKDGTFKYSEIKMISLTATTSFKVYPNPSTHNFYVEFAGLDEGDEIFLQLYDITEKIIWKKNATINAGEPYLLNDNLAPGIYILKITDNFSEYTFKLIKN